MGGHTALEAKGRMHTHSFSTMPGSARLSPKFILHCETCRPISLSCRCYQMKNCQMENCQGAYEVKGQDNAAAQNSQAPWMHLA